MPSGIPFSDRENELIRQLWHVIEPRDLAARVGRTMASVALHGR
jgi:hypothetical protein